MKGNENLEKIRVWIGLEEKAKLIILANFFYIYDLIFIIYSLSQFLSLLIV